MQRVDPRFALPIPIANAVVFGALDSWVDGFTEAGVPVTNFLAADSHPQLVVAPAQLAAEAIATRAEMVILEGRGSARRLRRAGFHTQTLLPIPSMGCPRHLVRPDHPRAALYAIDHWSNPTGLRRRLRNRLAKFLIAKGRFPDFLPSFTLGMRSEGSPFLLRAAERLGVPQDAEWFMTLGGFDGLSRSVFHVFAPGAVKPDWVVKFARVPGYTEPFDHDERGTRLAAAAGNSVARRVPTILGRIEANGLHASVERAAEGFRLTDLLERGIPRDEKLRVIEAVASWILELGMATRDSETLNAERDRVVREVLPHWAEFGVSASLVEQLSSVPSVLQHANLGPWNVIARDADHFFVIDWESVREGGFPLWDLMLFLTDALRTMDGALTRELKDRYMVELYRAEQSSSDILFRWLRRAVDALEIPAPAVGPLLTLAWLDRGAAVASRRAARASMGIGETWGETTGERWARLWLKESGLGPAWNAWQGTEEAASPCVDSKGS
jgi:hypothetical protein